jgi:hypothetical protein
MLLVVVFAPGALGCASARSASASANHDDPAIVTGAGFTAMICPWPSKVTADQVRIAEPAIQACVLSRRPDLSARLHRYARQYSSLTSNQLHVSFFDTRYHPLKELQAVCSLTLIDDGGDDYFEVVFDLDSGTCANILIRA